MVNEKYEALTEQKVMDLRAVSDEFDRCANWLHDAGYLVIALAYPDEEFDHATDHRYTAEAIAEARAAYGPFETADTAELAVRDFLMEAFQNHMEKKYAGTSRRGCGAQAARSRTMTNDNFHREFF